MHNGQIGGFEAARKAADMLIPDALYRHRRGATDSEAFFLVALGNGLATDPIGAIARTIATFEALATKTPKFRMTSVFSDGEILYAVRYASDGVAPTFIIAGVRFKRAGRWCQSLSMPPAVFGKRFRTKIFVFLKDNGCKSPHCKDSASPTRSRWVLTFYTLRLRHAP